MTASAADRHIFSVETFAIKEKRLYVIKLVTTNQNPVQPRLFYVVYGKTQSGVG